MQVENLTREERLKDAFLQIKEETRIRQKDLAALAHVSVSTIKAIERGDPRPKAETLRLIADGLATYGPGKLDPELADSYYDRLMRAAGYIEDRPATPPDPARPVDDLTDEEVVDELERRTGNRDVAVSLLAAAKNWRAMDPRSQRLTLETIRYAAGEDEPPAPDPRRR